MINERQTNGIEPAVCAWCAGTGRRAVSADYLISCLVCGGKGNLLLPRPFMKCRQCGGCGKRNATGKCLTCAGTGWERAVA